MKVVPQSFKILTSLSIDGMTELERIECVARTCYKSEPKIQRILGESDIHYEYRRGEITKAFIAGLIRRGHEAMLEHGSISVLITTDRGVSHELVRHRIASYAQESTRYCNYSKDKFGSEITVIEPPFKEKEGHLHNIWWHQCSMAEQAYLELLENGWTPQMARSVLPTCTKTDIVITANYREWRNILKLRCAPDAHPQMREIMLQILDKFHRCIPVLFDDIYEEFINSQCCGNSVDALANLATGIIGE